MICGATIGVFVGYGQNVVGLQGVVQTDVSQTGAERVFAAAQQTCILQFLVVHGSLEITYSIEYHGRLTDVASFAVVVHQFLVHVVASIAGHLNARCCPLGIADVGTLSQVGQSDDVAIVVCAGALVGYPYFHSLDGDPACDGGECLHVFVVSLTEEMRKEEVAVLLVVCRTEFEAVGLLSSLAGNTCACTLLLTYHSLHFQLAELDIGSQTEQTADARHETHVAGERDVACLDELHNLVLFAIILQFHVLSIIVEGRLCVVVEVQVNFVTHFTI